MERVVGVGGAIVGEAIVGEAIVGEGGGGRRRVCGRVMVFLSRNPLCGAGWTGEDGVERLLC